jgi:hypothetical protein
VKNNTPSTPLGDSQRRRDRAGEARAKAEAMIDPQSKKLMIRVAQAYEQLAEWAQIELWKGVITAALTWATAHGLPNSVLALSSGYRCGKWARPYLVAGIIRSTSSSCLLDDEDRKYETKVYHPLREPLAGPFVYNYKNSARRRVCQKNAATVQLGQLQPIEKN